MHGDIEFHCKKYNDDTLKTKVVHTHNDETLKFTFRKNF